jgi:hypothetical protein
MLDRTLIRCLKATAMILQKPKGDGNDANESIILHKP